MRCSDAGVSYESILKVIVEERVRVSSYLHLTMRCCKYQYIWGWSYCCSLYSAVGQMCGRTNTLCVISVWTVNDVIQRDECFGKATDGIVGVPDSLGVMPHKWTYLTFTCYVFINWFYQKKHAISHPWSVVCLDSEMLIFRWRCELVGVLLWWSELAYVTCWLMQWDVFYFLKKWWSYGAKFCACVRLARS